MRFLLAGLLICAGASAETIRVGIAISLKEAMGDIAKVFEDESKDKLEFTFGSSGQIEAQIKNGADIDVFISAANKQVDELTKEGLAVAETQRIVARNTVVLVVPASAKDAPSSFESLAMDNVKKIAIGEPKTVPAGNYAMQVLKNLRLVDKTADKIVYGANVRQVLSYVERGEVSAGIVYSSDAKISGDKVKIVATAKPDWHEPVVYPAIMIRASKKQASARWFLEYLGSDKAKSALRDKGFSVGAENEKKPAG